MSDNNVDVSREGFLAGNKEYNSLFLIQDEVCTIASRVPLAKFLIMRVMRDSRSVYRTKQRAEKHLLVAGVWAL